MTVQKKLPSDIEENIQNLAGDIYLQIEDKITALLTSYSDNIEVTSEVIAAHPHYAALEKQHQSELLLLSKNQEEKSAELNILKAELEAQQSKLVKLQENLSNAENLNNAKLTDSEQFLKEKLAENTQLAKQVATLNKENTEQQQKLESLNLTAENATQSLNEIVLQKEALAKNDKAKAATLTVQNQQYSDLQLKFEQVSSELEYLKAEQEQKLLSSNEQLTHEQQQANLLNDQIAALQAELENKQVNIDKQQADITLKAHENNDLKKKINSLEQTVKQNEKAAGVAKQQYELDKKEINTSLLNEQQKNAQALKLSSDNNEQIVKKMHDVERSKQAIESKLTQVNEELSLQKNQHQQVKEAVKSLETQVKKEQALSAKLSDENSHLKTTLAKTESDLTNIKEQQTKKVTELTKAFDKAVLEKESSQQLITQLEQKDTDKLEKINELTSQNKNEQLKHKLSIEKQEENHNKMVTVHQRELVKQNELYVELQRKSDTALADLSSQLEEKVKRATLESTKLAEIEVSYAKSLVDIASIEKDLAEKQRQLTAVQTELDEDRKKTANNRLLHQENKDKQEVEYNKARETIKYLRDENTELNRRLDQQISELEDKLTEYRLRFEYAQKELTKVNR